MRDSFKLEDKANKKEKKKKTSSNSNFIFFMICIFLAVASFGSYFIVNHVKNKESYIEKKDLEKEYIYVIQKQENPSQEDVYDEVPTINLEGENINQINENIIKKYEQVSSKTDYDYTYEFNQSDSILALKITYAYYPNETALYPIRYFETYHINLRNGKVLSDDEILKMYQVKSEQVNSFLEAKFKGYYRDLVNQKFYTEKECNYKCFLENRGISDNYLNGTSYYIQNGSLTVLKYFYIHSDYLEENYFKNTNYQFIVKK